ncbi:MAG: hypothetical protein A3B30_02190 [Candidatus Komeilibacteria bacterium RIFCSPLOWO2_01_FULL_52_15]|uniref:SHSP domain-containing protein n=2 Tax=Candidatus Komeiliibacteriota TaxID=1817908 RepID=A0A1G2BSL3_9BACT|nr:MAG: hypothetical protein A2677_01130 [Candidatus Komeilibacteria bacterium RIFCSPHIGHO2_01_FULL_52_14]OGY92174.1 MAG: hypothetical protein A3B30_02190 [Candidatus Komeilibacteria bacterium RIFCSPLOWO2_01_FULL_52_15]
MFGNKKEKHRKGKPEHFFDAAESASPDGKHSLAELTDRDPEWIDEQDEDGQLAVDVYEEGNHIIVKSTIAGIEPEDIDISLVNDMLTIRGERKQERTQYERDYFFQECYWGAFSRSIILPVEVDIKKIDATIKNGILTITLPKVESKPKKAIKVKGEDT